MAYVILVLILIVALLLGAVILVQNPKGGGLASGFESAGKIGGVQRTTDFLEKATWYLTVALFVLSMASSGFYQPLADERTSLKCQLVTQADIFFAPNRSSLTLCLVKT